MPLSGGLWTRVNLSSLVSTSFPYARTLWTFSRHTSSVPWSALLYMEGKTGYTAAAQNMSVRINGVEIGKVSPRPFGVGSNNLEPMTFIFFEDVLAVTGPNTLTVVPAGNQSSDFMIVGNWSLHYAQTIP
jgi:hypothetical protein